MMYIVSSQTLLSLGSTNTLEYNCVVDVPHTTKHQGVKMTAKIDLSKFSAKELADLIAQAQEQESEKAKQELDEKLQKVKDLITKLGLEVSQVAEALLGVKPKKAKSATPKASPIIFEFKKGDYSFTKQGLKGKVKDEAIATLKTHLKTKEEALKHAIGEDGKTFVEKIYK